MTPTPPFNSAPVTTAEGQVSLIRDAHDHILCAAFSPEDSDLIVTQLNRAHPARDPQAYNPFISAMLAGLRLRLEHELGAPLTDQPLPIGDLFSTLADWFGFNTGERAIAMGPSTIAYMDLQGELVCIPVDWQLQPVRIITAGDAITLDQAA